MTANIKFAKVRPDAKIPSKRDEDMGFDIYACFDEDYMVINPHETKLIPTGIASACNPEYGFVVFERGSTGSKGIARRCGVIDSGYRNEWFIGLTNTTSKVMFISKLSEQETYNKYYEDIMPESFVYPYSKAIAQALVIPVPKVEVEENSYEELKEIKSERGMGALGSSNK
jgi:dUTP pyrophosphatase